MGGILNVVENLKVKKVFISKQLESSENYEKFIRIVEKKHIKVLTVGKGDVYKIDNNIRLLFLWPNKQNQIQENHLNNNSVVCKLEYKNFLMLFTGDIEEVAEIAILEEYKNNLNILQSTILKVGHHGSKTSSRQDFLDAVNPQIGLIGVGKNNKFGHPDDSVIERLKNLRSKNISNRSNGGNFNFCR